jgi:hypothetical protein
VTLLVGTFAWADERPAPHPDAPPSAARPDTPPASARPDTPPASASPDAPPTSPSPGDEAYELVRGMPATKLAPGGRAVLSLSVVPRSGYRLQADAPVHVRLSGTGLKPQRTLYERDDAADPRADVPRFDLAVTADKHKGPARLDATLTFYVCKGSRCRPVETTATWSLQVE